MAVGFKPSYLSRLQRFLSSTNTFIWSTKDQAESISVFLVPFGPASSTISSFITPKGMRSIVYEILMSQR